MCVCVCACACVRVCVCVCVSVCEQSGGFYVGFLWALPDPNDENDDSSGNVQSKRTQVHAHIKCYDLVSYYFNVYTLFSYCCMYIVRLLRYDTIRDAILTCA